VHTLRDQAAATRPFLVQTAVMDTLAQNVLSDVVLACCRQPDLTVPASVLRRVAAADKPELFAIAKRHRVAGLLAVQAAALGWKEALPGGAWGTFRVQGLAQHLLLSGELRRVGIALDRAGISWLTFKGAALSACTYPRPDLRAYGDVDVLVEPADLRRTLDVLHQSGATLYAEPWAELQRTGRAQLNVVTAFGLPLDLHWSLFNNPGVRRAFPTSTTDLIARRRWCDVLGSAVPTLSESDELVFLAAHGAQSGANLLVWVLDLHLAAKGVRDWATVVETAHRRRLGLVTAAMLGRAQHLLGTPLPRDLLDELSGARAWKSLLAVLDRYRPPQRSVLGTGRLLMTSTRSSTSASVGHLARASWVEAVKPALQEKEHPWRKRSARREAVPSTTVDVITQTLAESAPRSGFLEWVELDGVAHAPARTA